MDIAKLIAGVVFLLAVAGTINLGAVSKLIVAIFILGGVLAVLLIYLTDNGGQPPELTAEEISELRQHRLEPIKTNNQFKWSVQLIRSLDWKVFEELCALYLQAKGRKANVTENGADGGVDVLLYSTSEPEKVVGVVQCKAWTKQLVGVKEVRELLGIMTDAGCPHGIYLTTSGYTAEAKAFAEGKQIHLRDSAQLLTLIKTLPVEKQDKILKQITSGDYTTPSCPNCGVKLVARGSKKANRSGQWFWGCPGFPRCRYTMRRPRAV